MDLTPAQRATLRTAIIAEPTLAAALAAGNDAAVADWLNASTAYVVWRSSVTPAEVMQQFVWAEVDALSVGKARIWDWMRAMPSIDAGIGRFRNGLSDCFGASSSTFTALAPVLRRTATRAESLLANGTGTEASPGRLRAEGEVSAADASLIRVL
jgi:hypothetical protein